jgi:hypothetical protein
MANMAYTVLGEDLIVFVCTGEVLAEPEWQAYARSLEPLVGRYRAEGRMIKFAVIADEVGPNAKQRAALVDVLNGVPTRTAVISNSMIMRNLITAFGWLNFSVKGFAPTQFLAAASYLELSREQRTSVLATASALSQSIGGVRCVESVVEFAGRTEHW